MVQTCKPATDRHACCSRAERLLEPDFFRALADPRRLEVLLRLVGLGRSATVSEVASCCEVDLSGVSRHLKALRQAGIAASERRGREVRYWVRYGSLAATLRRMAEAIEACCPTDSAPHHDTPNRSSRSDDHEEQ